MISNKGPSIGARHLQVLLLFFAIGVNFITRAYVSVALVAMTDAETTNPNFYEFNWNEKERSYILSSFYWGYMATQFPGGYLSRILGAKTCILIATVGSSLLNLLIPLTVYWGGWQVYCAIRVGQGLFQGLVFPSIHAHLAKWSPIEERTRLGGFAHLGVQIGIVLAMSLTGLIAASDFGWPGISYIYGGIGVVFCTIWIIFAENCPADARFITSEERKYIISAQEGVESKTKQRIPVPWKAILTSGPYISLLVVQSSQGWSSSIMQTQIPAYLHGVLNMDIKSNALFSTLPYIAMLIMSLVFLFGAGIVLKNQWAPLGVVRKTLNTIAMWGPAALLIGVAYLDENQKALAIAFLTLNAGLNGGMTIGSGLNAIDLSPNHVGILMGLLCCITNIIPIITPLAVGIIVYDETQRALWKIVFIIAAVFFFFGNLQYIIFGSTNTQPWNDADYQQKHDNKQNNSSHSTMTKTDTVNSIKSDSLKEVVS
ncbi:putative inorganic phosphate cotransporter [Eupeodes corollae]|uniref:putative inorganic phosphate cotransporter n=1 Tax=Eupeodes corollae TaxID=290404 RepID=UPI0024913E39|nr:putative inorganic phosphate cotransporter [Eupeodes corollae]